MRKFKAAIESVRRTAPSAESRLGPLLAEPEHALEDRTGSWGELLDARAAMRLQEIGCAPERTVPKGGAFGALRKTINGLETAKEEEHGNTGAEGGK